ncbi:MAG: hypothetical protein AABY26_04495 [Nanoarchaeota archaeon]
MPIGITETPEHHTFSLLKHWKPEEEKALLSQMELLQKKFPDLFSHLYLRIQQEYPHLPKRKDGKNAIVHPLNVARNLTLANINDELTLSAGLAHDLVEEQVDQYQHEHKIKAKTLSGIKILDGQEGKVVEALEKELLHSRKSKITVPEIKELLQIVQLLTRHKRHYYYRSISQIYTRKNDGIKEKAIQVKLADRIHNIQCLSCFTGEEKLYQCFKNLFILNNTKRYLLEIQESDALLSQKAITPTEKLFKKCAKATYDAFLEVCGFYRHKEIAGITSMLQLAFKKFALEKKGLWAVTEANPEEVHPLRLFQGIIKKYDARLHLEWDKFNELKEAEKEYCRRFFSDFNFNEKQLDALIWYKDAYALKEVVAMLLYDSRYVVDGFSCSQLCTRGRICMQE